MSRQASPDNAIMNKRVKTNDVNFIQEIPQPDDDVDFPTVDDAAGKINHSSASIPRPVQQVED